MKDILKNAFQGLRRVYPNLVANDIVTVQPMTAPAGDLFYLDYNYDPESIFYEDDDDNTPNTR